MDWRTRVDGTDQVAEELRYMRTERFARRLRGAAWSAAGADPGSVAGAADAFCDIVAGMVPDGAGAADNIIWLRKRVLRDCSWRGGLPVYSGMPNAARYLELYWALHRWMPVEARNLHLVEYGSLRGFVAVAWRAAAAAEARAGSRGRRSAVRDAARRETEYIKGYPRNPPAPVGGDDRIGDRIKESEWDIVVPHSVNAARYWGDGTFWCTSAVGSRENHFERYYAPAAGRVLFIFMNRRTGSVYQFEHWSRQFKDSGNLTCNDPVLVQCLHDMLRKFLRHKRYIASEIGSIQAWMWKGARRVVLDERGLLHSEIDGLLMPAVITARGAECWYRHGQLHSWNDEPSYSQEDGSRFWHKEGALHRVGGPAIVWRDGSEEWWEEGVRLR